MLDDLPIAATTSAQFSAGLASLETHFPSHGLAADAAAMTATIEKGQLINSFIHFRYKCNSRITIK